MRAIGYIRVSTDRQVEKYGLAAQATGLRQRAAERGYHLLPDGEQDLFVEDGYSGGDLSRPAMDRLRAAVRSGAVNVVLAYDPDRLSRSLTDLLLLADEFERQKVALEFITQETDFSPEGKLFFAIKGAVGQYERAKTRERTQNGILEKARQGKVVSSAACPFGYRYDREQSTLVIQEEEAEVVRMAFYLYSEERISLVRLAERLNQLNLPHPKGGKRWYLSLVGRMLRNETYAGVLRQHRWNRIKTATTVRDRLRPASEHLLTAVPPIVPRPLFEAVQRRLEQNRDLASRNTKHQYLLSGLVRHGCGAKMSGLTHAHGYTAYRCAHVEHTKAPKTPTGDVQRCRHGYVNGEALERAVWETVTGLLRDPHILRQEVERLRQPDAATLQAAARERQRIERRLAEAPGEKQRLIAGYSKALYSDDLLREQLKAIETETSSLQSRLAELNRQVALYQRAEELTAGLAAFAEETVRGIDAMDFNERRELLRLLVEEVVYDAGDITVRTIIPLDRLHPVGQGLREGDRVAALGPHGSIATCCRP